MTFSKFKLLVVYFFKNDSFDKQKRFLLPSEAYGILHQNLSLFSSDRQVTLIKPRRYEGDLDLENLYKHKNAEANCERPEFPDYSHFAETYYSNQDLERYIRIVKSEIKEELFKDAHFRVKQYNKEKTKSETDDQAANESKSEEAGSQADQEEKRVCRLRKVHLRNEDAKFDYEWHNPPKTIFKPFVQVMHISLLNF